MDISRAVVIKSELLSDSSDEIEEIECPDKSGPSVLMCCISRGIGVRCRQVSGRVIIGDLYYVYGMASVK
jgi:hypothetical protein